MWNQCRVGLSFQLVRLVSQKESEVFIDVKDNPIRAECGDQRRPIDCVQLFGECFVLLPLACEIIVGQEAEKGDKEQPKSIASNHVPIRRRKESEHN